MKPRARPLPPMRCPTCGTQYATPTGDKCGRCFLDDGLDVTLRPLLREVRPPAPAGVAEGTAELAPRWRRHSGSS